MYSYALTPTYQEGSTGPREGRCCTEEGRRSQDLQFKITDPQYGVKEVVLPGVQLDHLDPVQYLIHCLDTCILVVHLTNLQQNVLLWSCSSVMYIHEFVSAAKSQYQIIH